MTESPHVGTWVPLLKWQQLFQAIAKVSDRKEVEVISKALTQYLGKTDPLVVKGAIASLESRVAVFERKLVELGQLFG